MKYKFIAFLLLATILFVVGCQDVSQMSDEDLERISEKAVVCNSPYIRLGTGCCLDQNDNNICDQDESTTNIPSSSVQADTQSKPDKCLFGAGIGACTDYTVFPKEIRLTLTNGFGEDIIIVSGESTNCNFGDLGMHDWGKGENKFLILSECPYSEGDRTDEEVTITYRKTGSPLDHTISGKIEVMVEKQKATSLSLNTPPPKLPEASCDESAAIGFESCEKKSGEVLIVDVIHMGSANLDGFQYYLYDESGSKIKEDYLWYPIDGGIQGSFALPIYGVSRFEIRPVMTINGIKSICKNHRIIQPIERC